ncbi:hypothetical protein LSCM1_03719 [Leishmania martiniquensis]|uniref:Uncharacterized protein n=1 Tax=Leishmania martiniquensis TaxID=1580590 RepID=A0A836GUX1_9TRYP|nr:hypothetical protein LSCM1_03719 [Leishmania martiniquensis]
MVRRPVHDSMVEGHLRLRQPSRSRRTRRHSEEDNSSTASPPSASHRESQRAREREKLPIPRKRYRWRSRGSSSLEDRSYRHCRHRERRERRAGDGTDAKYRTRSEDGRDSAWQHQRRVRADRALGGGSLHRPCPPSPNASVLPRQTPADAPLATKTAVISNASLAVSVPVSSSRAESCKPSLEELVQSPQAPAPRMEAIDDRKHLFRAPWCPAPLQVSNTASAERCFGAVAATPAAAGVASTDSVHGAPLVGLLPSPYPSQRPPTPVFLPAAGAPPPSLSTAATAPFSEEDHFAWLCAPASPTESRASATVPSEVTAGYRGLARTERVPTSQTERERKREQGRSSVGATAAQLSHPSSASVEAQGSVVPALVQGSAGAPAATAPHALTHVGPQHEEISYLTSFSLHTSWDALVAAPPLLHTTPRMPSLLASDVRGTGTTAAHLGISASPAHARMGLDRACMPPAGTRGESLIDTSPATEKGEASQGGEAHTSAAQQEPGLPSLCCPPSPATASPKAECDSHECPREDLRQVEEDGARTFVKHFTNGLVFLDPPWFICPALLDNCEHPYYMTWLDELDVGSVEEAVTDAKAKLLADA